MSYKAKPTDKQLEWADLEFGVIIHYCMEIYDPEIGQYTKEKIRTKLAPEKINPTKLNTDQWLAAAAAAGAKYAVLVANHCTGFSLWQTDVEEMRDYSCAALKWKDGKGDVMADFIKSCEKYGLKPGVYYSTGCNAYIGVIGNNQDYKSEEYQKYVKMVERQVTELWSKYGKLYEIWFDGGIVPVEDGGPDLVPILKKYQPDAICFQGPEDHPHDIRWVGNEEGLAPENCWATTSNDDSWKQGAVYDRDVCGNGDPDGKYWWPAETDMPNRGLESFGGGWTWRDGEESSVYTPEHLLDCYLRSVGRNSNLLLGMAISTDGDFKDTKQFEDFGKLLEKTFGNAKASISGKGDSFKITFPEPTEINYISIMEDITDGQNIREYDILFDGEKFYSKNCIGHKRIIKCDGKKSTEIIFNVTKYVDMPTIRKMEIF